MMHLLRWIHSETVHGRAAALHSRSRLPLKSSEMACWEDFTDSLDDESSDGMFEATAHLHAERPVTTPCSPNPTTTTSTATWQQHNCGQRRLMPISQHLAPPMKLINNTRYSRSYIFGATTTTEPTGSSRYDTPTMLTSSYKPMRDQPCGDTTCCCSVRWPACGATTE